MSICDVDEQPHKGSIVVAAQCSGDSELLVNVLVDAGYRVTGISGRDMDLSCIEESDSDLILLDGDKPGLDLCIELKNRPATKSIPILFHCEPENAELKRAFFKAGAADYIAIPIEITELLSRVQTHVMNSQMKKQIACRSRELTHEIAENNKALSELQAIYENAPLVMLLVDKDRRVIKMNKNAIEMSRRNLEDSIGLRGGEALRCACAGDDPTGCGFGNFCKQCVVKNTVLETFEKGEPYHRVDAFLPYEHPSGTVDMQVSVSTSPLKIDDEDMVLVCLEEVTEQKRAEKALHISNRSLTMLSECRNSLARARTEEELLNNICHSLVEHGGYRLAWVGYAENDEAKSVKPVGQAGYDEDYLEQANLTWADTDNGRGPIGTAIRTNKAVTARHILTDPQFEPWREDALKFGYASSISLPLLDKDEVIGALNLYSSAPDAFDDENEVTFLEEITHDIVYGVTSLRTQVAHHRSLERQNDLQLAKTKAEVSAKLKDDFLANMSHELRTPLNGILGHAQVIQNESGINTKVKDGVDIILRSGNHLLDIINDVLDLSKSSVGKLTLSSSCFNLKASIETCIDMITLKFAKKGLQLVSKLDISPDLIVCTDDLRLRQVILNLLTNANKFTDQGEVTIAVYNPHGTTIRFEISDTGCGVSKKVQQNIFKPFVQAKDRCDAPKGAGLGLAISSQIVNLMGGTLEVRSELDKGSTFAFDIDLPPVGETPLASAIPEVSERVCCAPQKNTAFAEELDIRIPSEVVAKLTRAAETGDRSTIEKLIAEQKQCASEGEQPFFDQLHTYCVEFEFDLILEILAKIQPC